MGDLTNPQSLNRYSYVMNNPVNMTDPSGHTAVEAGHYGDSNYANATYVSTLGVKGAFGYSSLPSWVLSQSDNKGDLGDLGSMTGMVTYSDYQFKDYHWSIDKNSIKYVGKEEIDSKNYYYQYTGQANENWDYTQIEHFIKVLDGMPVNQAYEKTTNGTFERDSVWYWEVVVPAKLVFADNQEYIRKIYGNAPPSYINPSQLNNYDKAPSFQMFLSQSDYLPDSARDSIISIAIEYHVNEKFEKEINNEFNYLTGMSSNTNDLLTQKQINLAKNNLQRILDNHDPYTIIRSKAYISSKTASDPITKFKTWLGLADHTRVFNGNPNGGKLNSFDVKTLQYIVVDRTTGSVSGVNFVGETIEYLPDGKERRGRAKASTMSIKKGTNDFISGNIRIYSKINTADPLVSYAQPINDDLTFSVAKNGDAFVYGIQDGFPAHKIWVNSGDGYHVLYNYNKGTIYYLGPILGDTAVGEAYKKEK